MHCSYKKFANSTPNCIVSFQMDGNGPPEPHQSQGEDPSGYQAEEGQSDDLEYIPPSFDESSFSDFESPKTKRRKTIPKLKGIPGKPLLIKRSKPATRSTSSPFRSIRPDQVIDNYPNVAMLCTSIICRRIQLHYILKSVVLSRVECRNLSV